MLANSEASAAISMSRIAVLVWLAFSTPLTYILPWPAAPASRTYVKKFQLAKSKSPSLSLTLM